MNGSGTNEEITVWQLVRRWWWALLMVTVVAGAAGYGVATKLPKHYQSIVTFLVGPLNTDVALDASGSLTTTYATLANNQPVLASAIHATRAPLTVTQLNSDVTTTSNTVNRLVTITVSNSDPVMAAKLANALATRISQLAQATPQSTNAEFAAFDQESAVQGLAGPERLAVENALKRVLGASPAGQVSVLNPATPAISPASPKKPLIAILSTLAGLLIATLLLFARMSAKGGAVDERSLAELDETYLGAVDLTPARAGGDAVVVEARPTSPAAADYRMLAARLSLAGSNTRSVLVVDSTDGSAAAVVAANLAAALSRGTDDSVVLADVSTESTGTTKLLGLQGHQGYAELFAEPDIDALNGRVNELIVDRGDRVWVLPQGKGDVTRPVSAERARALVRRLGTTADFVVLAGPPVSHSPNGLSWARAADSVLFVLDGTKLSHNDVVQAICDLRLANASFLGAVVGRRPSTFPVLGRAALSRA